MAARTRDTASMSAFGRLVTTALSRWSRIWSVTVALACTGSAKSAGFRVPSSTPRAGAGAARACAAQASSRSYNRLSFNSGSGCIAWAMCPWCSYCASRRMKAHGLIGGRPAGILISDTPGSTPHGVAVARRSRRSHEVKRVSPRAGSRTGRVCLHGGLLLLLALAGCQSGGSEMRPTPLPRSPVSAAPSRAPVVAPAPAPAPRSGVRPGRGGRRRTAGSARRIATGDGPAGGGLLRFRL